MRVYRAVSVAFFFYVRKVFFLSLSEAYVMGLICLSVCVYLEKTFERYPRWYRIMEATVAMDIRYK